MWSALLSLFTWIAGFFLKKAPAPSRVEIDTERAAVAETKLSTISDSLRTQSAVAQAEAAAPKDTAGVEKALRGGTF